MIRHPILAPGEESSIEGELIVWWNNVTPIAGGSKFLHPTILIYSWDAGGRRYETHYNLFLTDGMPIGGTTTLAPGVYLSHRATKSRRVWLLKMTARATKARGSARKRYAEILGRKK